MDDRCIFTLSITFSATFTFSATLTFTFLSSSLSLSRPPGEPGQVLPAGRGRGWSGPCRGDRQQQQVEINEMEICGEESRQKINSS